MDSNALRRAFGINGISATNDLNLNNAQDPKKYDMQISGLALQVSITTLTKNAFVNTLKMSTLDTAVSSGIVPRYTKTERDTRYYTQTEITNFVNAKPNVLSISTNLTLNSLNNEGLEIVATTAVDQSISIISGSLSTDATISLWTLFDTIKGFSRRHLCL